VGLTALILLAGGVVYAALIGRLTSPPPPDPDADAGCGPEYHRVGSRFYALLAACAVALTAAGAVAWPAFIDWHFSRLPQGRFLIRLEHGVLYWMGGFATLALALPLAPALVLGTYRLRLGPEGSARLARCLGWDSSWRRFLLRASLPSLAIAVGLTWLALARYARFEDDRAVVSTWLGMDGATYGYDRVRYVVRSDWIWRDGSRSGRRGSVRAVGRFVVFDDRRVVAFHTERSEVDRLTEHDEAVIRFVGDKSGRPLTEVCFDTDVYKLP
jgi:hypothetical protein